MQTLLTYLPVLIILALVFGICFLVDKGFQKLFRSRRQHRSGKAIKMNSRNVLIALVLVLLGIAGIFQGGWLILLGAIVLCGGGALLAYHLSYGIYYDEDSFLVSAFGKKSKEYFFREIRGQRLYLVAGGNMIIELHMENGETVSLQTIMDGVFPFLDHAFAAWCQTRGLTKEDCPFHDPVQGCWFPSEDEEA